MKKTTIAEWIGGNIAPPIVRTLDARMKRLVTIASLFGYVFNLKKRDTDVELRLSRVMDLTDNANSLTLPILHHDMIWKIAEKEGNTKALLKAKEIVAQAMSCNISDRDVQSCADIFINNLPPYLQYAGFDEIKVDIVQFFKSLPIILASKQTTA